MKLGYVAKYLKRKKYIFLSVITIIPIFVIFQNCGTSQGVSSLTSTPSETDLLVGANYQFYPSSGSAPFSWSIISGGGSINPINGLFKAPSTYGQSRVRVLDSGGRATDYLVNTYLVLPTPTPTPTVSGNIYTIPAPYQNTVQLSGNNGGVFSKTMNFSTSSTLKIKVEALSAPNCTIPGYQAWVFPYGCMRVSVTVNGSTRQTKILKVAGTTQVTAECVNAPSTDILDFSDITTGDGPISVTFSNAEYDNCHSNNPIAYGCGMSAVSQKSHQVRFNTTIQTDNTYPL